MNKASAKIVSPNSSIQPVTAVRNLLNHLTIGKLDCVDLVQKYGSPLWIIDEETVHQSIQSCLAGLSQYPNSQLIYAGKAFLCTAICKLLQNYNIGLDVVSYGELFTAQTADFAPDKIYFHGNNKSPAEINLALDYGCVNFIVDNESELSTIIDLAKTKNIKANLMLRVTPDIETQTHEYIKTGHKSSKFGLSVNQIINLANKIAALDLNFLGLHVHLGSQSTKLKPYLDSVSVIAHLAKVLKLQYGLNTNQVNLGGGVGIKYNDNDNPIPLYKWSKSLALELKTQFELQALPKPKLILEPGRAIIGTAGVTIYTIGHNKVLDNGIEYISIDGGLADNPRPAMYQAKYTAELANRINAANKTVTIVGKYCESGDVLIKDINLEAKTGDLLVVYGTGAYNYTMSSNYNRTPRPACILVKDGKAEPIIKAETYHDLISHDNIPNWLE